MYTKKRGGCNGVPVLPGLELLVVVVGFVVEDGDAGFEDEVV